MLDKQYLRKEILSKRLAIDPSYAQSAAEDLAHHLITLIPKDSHVIAGYVPTRGEISPFPAMALLAEAGHTLCLPVVDHKDAPLSFRKWREGDALIKGSYGIEVPVKETVVIPDIVLTPLVAFDHEGYRLGYGAGYYDRTIAQLRQANKDLLVIGVAYAMQQVAMIPSEAHDEKLRYVVTEKESISIK